MEHDFAKLAQEIVVDRLKEVADPPALAAEIAHKIAVAAVTSTRAVQDPHISLASVCRGVMNGMLLIDKNLPKTAVALLNQMAVIAQETNLDPADCMTWAMEGIAPVVKLGPTGSADAVGTAIEENFMGAGEVFAELLRTTGS